jgi:hypothetical protein
MKNLFKTKREREKDANRERRHAFRQAENRVEDVKDRVRQMQKESSKQWEQAREALKGGQKAAAQRALMGYRAAQVLMTKMEQKRWVFEQYLAKMQAAQTDQEFASALAAVNKVTEIDPERVADVFDASQEVLGEQMDSDRFWSKLYDKEMEGASGALEDHIPSMEELGHQLEDEAAAEVGGAKAEKVRGEIDGRITAGQDRVRKLLDGK